MSLDGLDPRYRAILDTMEPYLVSHPGNWSALDLAPFGVEIAEERRYAPTSLRSRDVVDGLHRLDEATFGDQQMRMPRWVLFDCGAFPGIVFGFGRRSREDGAFVPLSMWVAVR